MLLKQNCVTILFAFIVIARTCPTICAQSTTPDTSSDASFDPQSLTKLAVVVSSSSEGGRGLGGRANEQRPQTNQQRFVEDVFVQDLLGLGHVVVARSDLKSVLKEQALSKSGLTDSNAVEVGKLLNVPAVLVVRINECAADGLQGSGRKNAPAPKGRVTLGARLVSVETGTILWQGSHTISEVIPPPAQLQSLLGKVANQLAKKFPAKQPGKSAPFVPKDIAKLALIMEAKSGPRGMRRSETMPGASDEEQLVEDKLNLALGNKGYSLVSRSDMQTLLKEKQFQSSGLTEENATAFGKLLNVPVVLVVRMTDTSQPRGNERIQAIANASLGARLISVETGEVLWCRTLFESQVVASKVDQSQVLTDVTKKIGDLFPARNK